MGQNTKGIISLDQLLAADDLGEELVDVPEWGGQVKIRGLSVKAINHANRRATVAGELDPEKITVEVLLAGIVEPELTPEHAGQLAGKALAPVNRIVNAIYRLSGIDSDTVEGLESRFREGAA